MAALSFVMDHTEEMVRVDETRTIILDDARIIESSLTYINDLLRSMLDINRARSGRIQVNNTPTDVLHDILEPAAAILCVRGARVQVLTECPPDLAVWTDQLRLKQIILNLAISEYIPLRNASVLFCFVVRLHLRWGVCQRHSQEYTSAVLDASKFAERGFIRIRAECESNNVKIFVEDSGPGVPETKRDGLFESFQESFDLLNQGTGIGLSICYSLTHLLGGKIYLDPAYDSGVDGCPGARFVVDLRKPPMTFGSLLLSEEEEDEEECHRAVPLPNEEARTNESVHHHDHHHNHPMNRFTPSPGTEWSRDNVERTEGIATESNTSQGSSSRTDNGTDLAVATTTVVSPTTKRTNARDGDDQEEEQEEETAKEGGLPSDLNVLFVDDETILRKLLIRLVRKAAPTWHVTEANSGERVLQLVRERHYDVIFMDQYMPCTDRTMLGTEIVRKLRTLGVPSMICGLSKNMISQEFMDAGADHFLLKPFPCKREDFLCFLRGLCGDREFGRTDDMNRRENGIIHAAGSILATDYPISRTTDDESDTRRDRGPVLPASMRVLLVDDENVLRKLFVRSVRRVAPSWQITEASNGERALELVRANLHRQPYDLIFMDQYMPSAMQERPLLGTDVVKEIRRIVQDDDENDDGDGTTTAKTKTKTLICGLSANEMQMEFYEAGADWFLLKPFPCDRDAFRNEMTRFCNIRKLHKGG